MDDASLNRRVIVRMADAVAFAQIGIAGLDGQIELEALRLYGLPEGAPALLTGTPTVPAGQQEFAAEVALDLPSLAGGAVQLVEVAVAGARQGDRAEASLASSTRFIELDAAVWSNNTVREMAQNISGATFDLAAVTLSAAAKRRAPWACSRHAGRSSRRRTGPSTSLDSRFAGFDALEAIGLGVGMPAETRRNPDMARARSGAAP